MARSANNKGQDNKKDDNVIIFVLFYLYFSDYPKT